MVGKESIVAEKLNSFAERQIDLYRRRNKIPQNNSAFYLRREAAHGSQ